MHFETRNAPSIRMTQVAPQRILGLRRRVLGRDELAGDEDRTTWHFAAYSLDNDGRASGEAIGCVTYMFKPLEQELAWRLNALGVDPSFRGHRIGLKLLQWTEKIVAEESLVEAPMVRLFWCEARKKAISTYEMNGWACVSDFFEKPGFGLYRRMTKNF